MLLSYFAWTSLPIHKLERKGFVKNTSVSDDGGSVIVLLTILTHVELYAGTAGYCSKPNFPLFFFFFFHFSIFTLMFWFRENGSCTWHLSVFSDIQLCVRVIRYFSYFCCTDIVNCESIYIFVFEWYFSLDYKFYYVLSQVEFSFIKYPLISDEKKIY